MNIEIAIGSITEQDVDGIVNSANTSLVMGSGVAAAILAEAGPEVEEEAMAQGPVGVGEVVVTGVESCRSVTSSMWPSWAALLPISTSAR